MKHCCLNCHFLAKESRDAVAGPHVFSWNSKDRNRKIIKDHYAAKCWWGIWDAGVDPKLTEKLMDIVNVSRANTCFFVEAHDGMQFEAAKELQNRKQENRELKRGRMFPEKVHVRLPSRAKPKSLEKASRELGATKGDLMC